MLKEPLIFSLSIPTVVERRLYRKRERLNAKCFADALPNLQKGVSIMRYLLICYVNPAAFGQMSQSEIGAHLGSYLAFNQEAQAAGVLRAAEQTEQVPPFTVSVKDN
jgi:hypothetical protein